MYTAVDHDYADIKWGYQGVHHTDLVSLLGESIIRIHDVQNLPHQRLNQIAPNIFKEY